MAAAAAAVQQKLWQGPQGQVFGELERVQLPLHSKDVCL